MLPATSVIWSLLLPVSWHETVPHAILSAPKTPPHQSSSICRAPSSGKGNGLPPANSRSSICLSPEHSQLGSLCQRLSLLTAWGFLERTQFVGWMDEGVDKKCVKRRKDGWMDVCCIVGSTDELNWWIGDSWRDRWVSRWTDRWIMDGKMDGWITWWVDRWVMGRRMNYWMDSEVVGKCMGWMDVWLDFWKSG